MLFMNAEDNHHLSEQDAPTSNQEKPFSRYRGAVFQAVIKEEERGGETHMTVGVFDGKEMVIFDFTTHIQGYKTYTLTAEEVAQAGIPVQSERTLSPGTPSPDIQRPAPEKKGKPTKITGIIKAVEALTRTKKQAIPKLFFTVDDTVNQVERRLLAFGSIAVALASPETNLQLHEPITLFAHKHLNQIHISGQKREVEDWYVQSALYHEKRFEKPKGKKQREKQ
jgi:hypothetical protein